MGKKSLFTWKESSFAPLPTAKCDLLLSTLDLKDKRRKKGGVGHTTI